MTIRRLLAAIVLLVGLTALIYISCLPKLLVGSKGKQIRGIIKCDGDINCVVRH